MLTLRLGQRDDLSAAQLKDLLAGSIDVIRRRLFEVVKPERQAAIKQAMSEITGVTERAESRDFAPAQRTVLALHRDGALGEGALLNFAKAFKYEESVAALSAMTGVKIETLDRLISGDRYDPILIAGKAIGLEWATVRALILLRLGPNRTASPADIENARREFRAPDAFDRRARRRVLEDAVSPASRPAIGNMLPNVKAARYACAHRRRDTASNRSRGARNADGRARFRPMPTGSATTDTP